MADASVQPKTMARWSADPQSDAQTKGMRWAKENFNCYKAFILHYEGPTM